MFRLFFTLYSGLLMAVFCFIFIGHMINTYMIVDVENILKSEHLTAEIRLLEKLSPYIDEQDLQKELDFIAEKNQLIIEEINKEQLPAFVFKALAQQQVWRDDEPYDYFTAFAPKRYFRLQDNENHPLILIEDKIDLSIWLALLASLAIAISIWFYLLHRKLSLLNNAAIDIGQGKLTTRVPVNKHLAIGKLNTSFNQMAERVQELLSSHKQLTHYIAHELRTPLFKMQLQLELLEECVKPEGISHLNGLDEDIENLQIMVEELLHYAQIERAELRLQPATFELQPFFYQLLNNVSCQQDLELQFSYQFTDSVHINADKLLLERALSNVLSNAIKYGHGWLHVTVSPQHQQLHIRISDNGPGIPKEQREQIFKAFQRGDRAKHSMKEGFGLGLAICANIIQLHQGNIKVETSSKGGASFVLLLPVLTEKVNPG